MELVEKAWCINNSNLQEPWFVPQDVVYAKTRGKAKTELFELLKYENVKTHSGDEINFLNLRVSRAKLMDKYLVDGKLKTKEQIEYDKRVTQRNAEIDKFVSENPDGFAYVRKNGWFWRPNNSGYTEYKHLAGIYPIKKAASIVKSSSLDRNDYMVLIDVTEHNKMLQDYIDDLKSRFL